MLTAFDQAGNPLKIRVEGFGHGKVRLSLDSNPEHFRYSWETSPRDLRIATDRQPIQT